MRITLDGMEYADLVALEPDSDLVAGYVRLGEACVAADSPWAHPSTPARARALLRHGWDGEAPRTWVALRAGEVVGTVGVWASKYDNLDSIWVDVAVHPAHRRRGLGTLLLRHAEQLGRDEGRTVVGGDAWQSDAASAFAQAQGYEQKAVDVCRRQLLAEVPHGWREAGERAHRDHAADYELTRVFGAVPDDLIESVAELWGAINDAPTDDLIHEDEVFPIERIRAYEATQLEVNRLYHVLARHRPSGRLAGHSVVAVETERPLGSQHDTSVLAEHRGHRLGLVLKTEMLAWIADAEPGLEEIETWNAESNAHMIAVNEQLGYQVVGRGVSFQRRLAR